MKNCKIEKCILVVAAFCLFINSIGFSYIISNTKESTSKLQQTVLSNSEEIKSSLIISFFDSEEQNFEFENEKDSEEDGGSDTIFSFLEKQLIASFINNYNQYSIVNNELKHVHSLPYYIQYENFRL